MKLHYRKYGNGQALVILHGLFGISDNWQTLGKAFAGKFTVYLVDMRNHGHSPHADEMDYYAMAEDIKELLDDEQLQHVILMGHSMGGKAAMFFAQQYGYLLDKLIVVDMGLKKYPPHHDLIFEALMAVDLDIVKTRKEAEAVISSYLDDSSVIQFLMKNLYWSDKEKLEWRMNIPVLYREIENILEAVPTKPNAIKTLFVRGEKSNYILENDFEEMHKVFINSEIITINGAGHWVHAEKPKEFYEAVMKFIG